MTLFDVFSKREADDTGLPKQVSDEELLAWGDQIRSLPTAIDDDFVIDDSAIDDAVIDLRTPPPRHAAKRPLVAAPESSAQGVLGARRVLRARPLVAAPAELVDQAR